jgi:hypothetical protein
MMRTKIVRWALAAVVAAGVAAVGPGEVLAAGTAQAKPATKPATKPPAKPVAKGAAASKKPAPAKAEAAPRRSPGVQVKRADGLVLHADLRTRYLAGVDALVRITARNSTSAPLKFPDLSERPWLVRFGLRTEGQVPEERFTTPPKKDPGGDWTIEPGGQKSALLEIPTSAALQPGTRTLAVRVLDGDSTLDLPKVEAAWETPQPSGGAPTWEPELEAVLGSLMPWVQRGASGFDLYLAQFKPRTNALQAHYHLASLPAKVEPILARSRTDDGRSRHVYWKEGDTTLRVAALDGTGLAADPRAIGLPYPGMRFLGRGASDGGSLCIPAWVPAPKGAAGAVKITCVDARGGVGLRTAADLPAAPYQFETAVDASGQLVSAVAGSAGVDIFRAERDAPAAFPAKATRALTLPPGARVLAMAFDVLPDQLGKPGGLALLVMHASGADAQRTWTWTWVDLGGKVLAEGTPRPWKVEGNVISLLPGALGPFHFVVRGSDGNGSWGASDGSMHPLQKLAPGMAWPRGETLAWRTTAPSIVVGDRELGPLVK